MHYWQTNWTWNLNYLKKLFEQIENSILIRGTFAPWLLEQQDVSSLAQQELKADIIQQLFTSPYKMNWHG